MNRTYLYLAAVWLGGSFIPCGAQTDEDKTAPQPPYVATVATPGMWTIQVKYMYPHPTPPPPPAPPPGVPVGKVLPPRYLIEIQVTKTEDKKRMVFSWSDGSETEVWHADGYVLFRQPQFAANYVAMFIPETESRGPSPSEFLPGDFPTLSWLDIKTYKYRESHNGHQCFCFESGLGKAWITVDTKLPVTVDNRETIQDYTFSKDAPQNLTLPPLYAKKLDDYLAKKAAVVRLPPPN